MTSARHVSAEDPQGSARNPLRLSRPHWWQPAAAALLAAASVGISLVGYQTVTTGPQHPLDIVVEEPFTDELELGITPESIQAAAEGHYVYEPFTLRVVSRELEWDEYQHGEIGDADALLSIALDRQDSDEELEEWEALDPEDEVPDHERFSLSWAARNNIAFADPEVPYTDYRMVEDAFTNNLTLGHGPSAVVGAAITVGELQFNGPARTPALWVPLAGLPLVGAIALMWFWQRARAQHRHALDRFSEAKLTLARVVLELDALEVRYIAARQALSQADGDRSAQDRALIEDWESIRRSSLELARVEQELEKLFAGHAGGHETDDTLLDITPGSPQLRLASVSVGGMRAFTHFEQETAALKERADALAAASELQAGHASSQSVLDRLALPLIQAIDELMRRDNERPGIADLLRPHRESLLTLSVEAQGASSAGDAEQHDDEARAQQLVADHADLLQRWGQTEDQMLEELRRWRSDLTADPLTAGEGELGERVAERVRARIRALTGGEHESFDALRRTLGLGHGRRSGPLYSVEHCLELLDSRGRQRAAAAASPTTEEANWWARGSTLAVVVPLLVALGAGFIAAGQAETNTRYGKVLEGEQELASIQVLGDVSALGEPGGLSSYSEVVTHDESLELDYIRESMERSADFGEQALLPEQLDLTVMILPVDDYLDYQIVNETNRDDLHFDYFELLEVYHQIKLEAAQVHPEVLDPETFEVAQGQALLPVWVLEDGRYGASGALTGDISTGVDSRLGAYDFQYTRIMLRDLAEDFMLLGDYLSYDLAELGRAMEYNHQEAQQVSGTQVFWLTAVTAWGGIQMLLIIGTALLDQVGRRFGSLEARRQLKTLRAQLNELSLGLDLSRLDMVAVLGGESATGGRAEEADQRLYEAGLVTALRQVQALERLPRKKKRGEDWVSRVEDAQRVIDGLSARDRDTSQRAEELLRSQRSI